MRNTDLSASHLCPAADSYSFTHDENDQATNLNLRSLRRERHRPVLKCPNPVHWVRPRTVMRSTTKTRVCLDALSSSSDYRHYVIATMTNTVLLVVQNQLGAASGMNRLPPQVSAWFEHVTRSVTCHCSRPGTSNVLGQQTLRYHMTSTRCHSNYRPKLRFPGSRDSKYHTHCTAWAFQTQLSAMDNLIQGSSCAGHSSLEHCMLI